VRIFCIGGSVLYGFPFDDSLSIPTRLRENLGLRLPSTPFEVINAGAGAASSEKLKEVVAAAIEHEADLLVLYMGNNELLVPYAVESAKRRENPLYWHVEKVIEAFQLTQALSRFKWDPAAIRLDGFQTKEKIGDTPWGGGRIDRAFLIDEFARNLDEISGMVERASSKRPVRLVLCTPPVDRAAEPIYSFFRAALSKEEKAAWMEAFREGDHRADAGDLEGALERYRAAMALDSSPAILNQRLGRILYALGDREEAALRFEASLAGDDRPRRATDEIRDLIRLQGKRTGVIVADLDSDFARALSGPIIMDLDRVFFIDGVHLTPAGARFAAQTISEALARAGVPAPGEEWRPSPPPGEEELLREKEARQAVEVPDRSGRDRFPADQDEENAVQ